MAGYTETVMRGTTVVLKYNGDWPDEVRQAFDMHVRLAKLRFPSWLRVLVCIYAPDLTGVTMRSTCYHEYGEATLFISPHWIEGDHRQRRADFGHEVLHLFRASLDTELPKLLEEAIPDKEVYAVVLETMRHRVEETTTDLTYALDELNVFGDEYE